MDISTAPLHCTRVSMSIYEHVVRSTLVPTHRRPTAWTCLVNCGELLLESESSML